MESGYTRKENDLVSSEGRLEATTATLERCQKDLVDTLAEARRKNEEMKSLSYSLNSEKAECSALQTRQGNISFK